MVEGQRYRSVVSDFPDEATPARGAAERIRLRYAGVCRVCGIDLPARSDALYERSTKRVSCVECPDGSGAQLAASLLIEGQEGTSVGAGSSARREYERRRAKDEDLLRQKWGKLGGIAVALSDEKQSTKAWATGAVGEERLGARLDSIADDSIAVLHDRRIPGTKANIDHIVITGGGIWVIDAKRYKGRPELKLEGGILRPRVERLLVGRRDCTKLVDGVLKQVSLVSEIVRDLPVVGVLCFVEADWPVVGGSFSTRGVRVVWPKRLARLLRESAGSEVDVVEVHRALAAAFPPA